MALLIDIRDPGWMTEQSLKEILQPLLPGVEIACGEPGALAQNVTMLAAVKLFPGVVAGLPNLKLVQKLGAGVDAIVTDPDLRPEIKVTRLRPDVPAHEIAEFCVAYVLQYQRNILFHQNNQTQRQWQTMAPKKSASTTVAVLGLGHIGGRTARYFSALGFRVIGWSRTAKSIEGVECRHGQNALEGVLSESDYVACILPSTNETRNLFDTERLMQMKPGAILLNAGRGDLIVEMDLLNAINKDQIGGAVLDVFQTEPLPVDHFFWDHPKVTVTPHVSGWHLDGGLEDIAQNYLRLESGKPLLNEVSRAAGY